jgi:hypothetical protein
MIDTTLKNKMEVSPSIERPIISRGHPKDRTNGTIFNKQTQIHGYTDITTLSVGAAIREAWKEKRTKWD